MIKTLSIVTAALLVAGAAHAATVTVGDPSAFNDGYATTVTYNSDNAAAGRGTADGRANGANALGAADGKFFEIGTSDEVILTFGTSFVSPGSVTEVTFGSRTAFPEFANVYVGTLGSGVWTLVNEAPISNASPTTSFTFAGTFDALKFDYAGGRAGGFDIDSVQVTPAPVPLPAAGVLLLGALGGLSMLRRRG